MIPVGGTYTLTPMQAVAVIKETEPSIVIPMHYGREELNKEAFGMLSSLAEFLKEMGKEGIVPVPKMTITKDKIPEEMQVVVLSS